MKKLLSIALLSLLLAQPFAVKSNNDAIELAKGAVIALVSEGITNNPALLALGSITLVCTAVGAYYIVKGTATGTYKLIKKAKNALSNNVEPIAIKTAQ